MHSINKQDEFKEKVRATNPIREVVADYVELNGGSGLCPFHTDTNPSFHVYPDSQQYHCFGCDAHGDVFDFVMRTQGLSFPEALDFLAKRAGLEQPNLTAEDREEIERERKAQQELASEVDRYHTDLSHGSEAYERLIARGISEETIKRFRLGWDKATGRVTLPMFRHGMPVYLLRWLPSQEPKYLLPKGSEKPVVGSEHLQKEGCIVVEGYFDWLSLVQAGYPAVAIIGNKPSEAQLDELRRSPSPILMLDGDDGGRKGVEHFADKLSAKTRIAVLPEGKDPNSLAQKLGEKFKGEIERIILEAKSLLDFELEDLQNVGQATQKIEIAETRIIPLIAKHHGLRQDYYKGKLRETLEMDKAALDHAVARAVIGANSHSGANRPFALPLGEFMEAEAQETQFLVEDLIPRGGVAILAARPKVGKSLLAFNLAFALAEGKPFLGHETTKTKTLIVQLEDPSPEIRKRLNTMAPECQSEFDHEIFIRAGSSLGNEEAFKRLPEVIKQNDIGLVVIDPFVFFAGGLDENDAAKMGEFFGKIRKIAFDTGATILIVHHHRKSAGDGGEGIRGSSAILAAVDVALELHRDRQNETAATLKVTSRHARIEDKLIVLDPDTLTWHSNGAPPRNGSATRREKVLEYLDENVEADIEELAEAAECDPKTLRPELKEMVDDGLLEVRKEKSGSAGRPRELYALKSEF